jgi:arginyl-tRNA synthetase
MLTGLKRELARDLAEVVRDVFGVEHDPVVEVPPRRDLGDLAFPAPLQLARVLRRNPRDIAQELVDRWRPPEVVREVGVAGAGYVNVFLRRPAFAERAFTEAVVVAQGGDLGKVVVEHTNINPNKAAHIGHLRNAVLGDILVRLLRAMGHPVEVQNYIDDTGVQLADVVVGFMDLEGKDHDAVAALPEPFDYTCWDLYSRVGRWYEEDPARRELRQKTLHALETNTGDRGRLGRLVARRIVHRHLNTMARLGIGYDLLTRESDILGLDFFEQAFAQLRERDAIRNEEAGKNAGCWVMPLTESEEFAGLEDPDKVIVRSDGTVTYVGKDIAYQLWKFGLLGRDFHYRFWTEEGLWETTSEEEPPGPDTPELPEFGGASRVINVIDARQSYLQRIVRAGLEALGHEDEAQRSIHFAYEMVALSADTARQLGFGAEEDGAAAQGGKALEMSGRKGIGVKADDLMNQLESRSREEIEKRNRDLPAAELDALARQIATAALRFFMAKATTTRVIAFDFDEALAFEGETGPYLQYSSVRARNIQRRLAEEGLANTLTAAEIRALPEEVWEDDLWDLVLGVAQIQEMVAKGAETLELSLVARHGLELAQKFNAVYHQHPILQEKDETLRSVRLAATLVFQRGLETVAELLGVPLPERM